MNSSVFQTPPKASTTVSSVKSAADIATPGLLAAKEGVASPSVATTTVVNIDENAYPDIIMKHSRAVSVSTISFAS